MKSTMDHETRTVLSDLASLALNPLPADSKPHTQQHHDNAATVTVTVTELKKPLTMAPSPPTTTTSTTTTTTTTTTLTTFPLFPFLPAELRLQIWQHSLLPRVVELHTRRAHYVDYLQHDYAPKWQSLTLNPAALSVCSESRSAALAHYTAILPLAAAATTTNPTRDPTDRVLYLNLKYDTIVLLGDVHFSNLTTLLRWCRAQDREGVGLRRLAMSAVSVPHQGGARMLRALAQTAFREIEQFVLVRYADRKPPDAWAAAGGGSCVLVEEGEGVEGFYVQFREGGGWMVVGKRRMAVLELRFVEGWQS
ncbi:hypothetical protein B0T22DRAFT_242566 [Podospora appendiculata]|uniref:2EXR domain-containing protein n=1 Tax=Podospora appendiculata TaxID=314037 RepID=A0AAE0X7G7_9PEZI|nr:hypothetical protein B0T22DRAFT_242566 [Podospora appendiculata]